jgi:hypothetical protein
MKSGHRRDVVDATSTALQVIAPPATATIGTPAHGAKGALLAQLREPGTVFMMGDNPALPRMPERPSLGDFRLRFDPFSASHLLQSAKMARSAAWARRRSPHACCMTSRWPA